MAWEGHQNLSALHAVRKSRLLARLGRAFIGHVDLNALWLSSLDHVDCSQNMVTANKDLDDDLKRWVENWKVVGPELDRMRREEIRRANTQESIQLFNLAFKAALRNTPPRQTSGLVEFQRLLKKLPHG